MPPGGRTVTGSRPGPVQFRVHRDVEARAHTTAAPQPARSHDATEDHPIACRLGPGAREYATGTVT